VLHGETDAIGWRIAQARKESGLTQEELAALIGVSARSIQGYEAGKVVPYRRLSELAKVTNRELDWMLRGDGYGVPALDGEVGGRLIEVIEELSAEATRIRVVAERMEHLLAEPRPTPRAPRPRARGSGARP
jgi:transcriptional regulator with XRE-family HTH domain